MGNFKTKPSKIRPKELPKVPKAELKKTRPQNTTSDLHSHHELNIPVQIPIKKPHNSNSSQNLPTSKSKSILAAENAVLDQVNKLTSNELKKRSSVEDVSKALANLRNETLQQLSASELKETKLDVVNAKLKHELKLLSSECQRLVAERDTAVDEMMSILQRNQNLEQDRNRIRHQFNLYRETKSQEVKRLSEAYRKAKSANNSLSDLSGHQKNDNPIPERPISSPGLSNYNTSEQQTQTNFKIATKIENNKNNNTFPAMKTLEQHNADFIYDLKFPLETAITAIFKLSDINIQLKYTIKNGLQQLQLPTDFHSNPQIKLSFDLFRAIHQIKFHDNNTSENPPKSCYITSLIAKGKLHLANTLIRKTIERVEVGENPNYDQSVDSLFGLGALCNFCLGNTDRCFNDLEEINDVQIRTDLIKLFKIK